MKFKLKAALAGLAALCGLAAGLFLPYYTAAVQDARTLGALNTSDAEQISYEDSSALGVVEKLALIHNFDPVELKNGLYMDEETAYSRALEELRRLDPDGLLQFQSDSCTFDEAYAVFYIDSGNPESSMIAWNVFVVDDSGNRLMLTVDDATGVIFGLYIVFSYDSTTIGQNKELYSAYLENLDPISAELKEYYHGLGVSQVTIKNSDSRFSMSLSDGNHTAELYLDAYGGGFSIL